MNLFYNVLMIEKELDMEGELPVTILRPFLKKLISYGNASENE